MDIDTDDYLVDFRTVPIDYRDNLRAILELINYLDRTGKGSLQYCISVNIKYLQAIQRIT